MFFRLFTERLESVAKERDNNRLLKAERAKRRLYKSLAEEGSQLKISSKKKKNAPKAAKGTKEKMKKLPTRKHLNKESESEDEDSLCLMCLEPYSASKPGQQWIQCISCRKWAHLECGNDSALYTCVNCLSDAYITESESD